MHRSLDFSSITDVSTAPQCSSRIYCIHSTFSLAKPEKINRLISLGHVNSAERAKCMLNMDHPLTRSMQCSLDQQKRCGFVFASLILFTMDGTI